VGELDHTTTEHAEKTRGRKEEKDEKYNSLIPNENL